MKNEIYELFFMVYLVGLILSFNLFFFIFVNDINDLTPNLTLAIVSLPAVLILLVEIIKKSKGGIEKNAKK